MSTSSIRNQHLIIGNRLLFIPTLIYASFVLYVYRRRHRQATKQHYTDKHTSWHRPVTPQSKKVFSKYELPDAFDLSSGSIGRSMSSPEHDAMAEMAAHPAFATPVSPLMGPAPPSPAMGWRQKLRAKKHVPVEVHELSAVKSLPNSKASSKRQTKTLASLYASLAVMNPFPHDRCLSEAEKGEREVPGYTNEGLPASPLPESIGWPLDNTVALVSPISDGTPIRTGTHRTAIITPIHETFEGKMF